MFLVLGLVDQLVLGDPGHHGAELRADFFDLVAVVHAADALEAGGTGAVFLHPVGGELAGLDVVQTASLYSFDGANGFSAAAGQ